MIWDMFKDHQRRISDQSPAFEEITPSEHDLDEVPVALYVGCGGLLAVVGHADDHIVKFHNIPDGSLLPIRIRRVAAETTCSNIVALY